MITCVRFSPDGNFVATCGTDKKINIYDGKTGDKIATHTGLHTGGIYGLSWLDDNKTLLTASADKTAALVDSTNGSEVARFKFGGAKPTTSDQQLGCLWTKEAVMTFNLDGEISIVDPANPTAAPRVITGHNKGIYALAAKDGKFYTGGTEHTILQWDAATGVAKRIAGTGHSNQVSTIAIQGNTIISGAYDNSIRFTPIDSLEYGNSITTDAPVMGIAPGTKSDLIVATTKTTAYVIRGGKTVSTTPISYTATCITLSPDETEVAIGGEDCKIHIYKVAGNNLEAGKELDGIRGALSCLAYSPDGAHLASADASRNILVWDNASKTIKVQGWIFHAARINSIAWSPDNVHLSSAGIDSDIYVWSVAEPAKKAFVKGAHPGGALATAWLNEKTVLSAGQDCAIKSWTVAF
jgi:WD40 repeat protein